VLTSNRAVNESGTRYKDWTYSVREKIITEKKDNGVIIVVFCLCNICATRGEISLNDGSGYLIFYWRKVLTYIV